MAVFRHLRVTVFHLSNTNVHIVEYQKIQPAKTIELHSFASRVVTYDIACKIRITKSKVIEHYTVPLPTGVLE